MFECDKCGLCCTGLDKHENMKEFHGGDGVCFHLNTETMLCDIYESRPLICRVDDFYDAYLKGKMSREEYYRLNYEACKKKKRDAETRKG